MTAATHKSNLSLIEFVVIISLMMSLTALSIDATWEIVRIRPALGYTIVAGIGAAIVGSLSTFISVPLGTAIGQSYNGTVLPLIAGLAILSALSLVVIRWVESVR